MASAIKVAFKTPSRGEEVSAYISVGGDAVLQVRELSSGVRQVRTTDSEWFEV